MSRCLTGVMPAGVGFVLAALLFASPGISGAFGLEGLLKGSLDFSGLVEAELRIFPVEPAHPDQDDTTISPSIRFQPELRYEWNRDDNRLTFIPFLRLDADDDNRTHYGLRELSYYHNQGGWDLLVGVSKVFWGVTESRHLIDIVNQTDRVEDIDEEEKLGQPMINLNLIRDWGTLGFFFLPFFRERTFPDREARLRGGLFVDAERAVFDDDLRGAVAVRWSHTIKEWDFGLYEFYGTGREPRLVLRRDPSDQPVLIPRYDTIDQTGLDVQYTKGNWLWKLEAIMRGGQGDRFGAFVAGFEYTFFRIFGAAADLGALVEYLKDGRGEGTPFDNDMLFGVRLAVNDEQSTAILTGVIVDLGDQSTSYNFEAERRISDRWRIEVISRAVLRAASKNILFGNRDDDGKFITLKLSYFF